MGYYIMINGVRWYYRLKQHTSTNNRIKKGLFNDKPRHTLSKSLIVSLSYQDAKNDNVLRLFSNFKSYLEFAIYQ